MPSPFETAAKIPGADGATSRLELVDTSTLRFKMPAGYFAVTGNHPIAVQNLAVLAGHWRYAHINAIRGDGINPELLGMTRVASALGR